MTQVQSCLEWQGLNDNIKDTYKLLNPAHIDLCGNIIADHLAKEAINPAKPSYSTALSIPVINYVVLSYVKSLCQLLMDFSGTTYYYRSLISKVSLFPVDSRNPFIPD